MNIDLSVYRGHSVLLTGWRGFLGKVVHRQLEEAGAIVVPFTDDLTRPVANREYERVSLVIHLAAKIAGIAENKRRPFDFLWQNVQMAGNVVEFAARRALPIVAASSVCAYPQNCTVPFYEAELFNGRPEKSNFGYGVAKRLLIAALECAAEQQGLPYVCLVSANLYGPGDNFGERAHVIPALIEKFSEATGQGYPVVDIWGSGTPTRDFLHVRDAARAFTLAGAHLLRGRPSLTCNIGSGEEVSIATIASMIAEVYDYRGHLRYDRSQPDGQQRRRQNTVIARHVLGWQPQIPLRVGLEETIAWAEGALWVTA